MKRRFGLSLLELLLAMTITVMVAAAISGMLGAVSAGVGTRRDTRSVMVKANAAGSRLSAYIAPSRCILQMNGANLALWLNDGRESDTVHATEIRWLEFDPDAGTIDVAFVDFPSGWSQAAKDLEDDEYQSTTNWGTVLTTYEGLGWVARKTLVDGLESASITVNNALVMDSRHAHFELGFEAEDSPSLMMISATLRQHEKPSS